MGLLPLLLLFSACLLAPWKLLCFFLRRRRSSLVSRLHPLRDSHTILAHLAFVDFPFTFRRSLEFGLFRTYAIPSISRTLSQAGHFALNASKRYDDTDILVRELLMHHPDGDRGSLALRRLNFIHSQYRISNADFLYVLSIFILVPLEWISKYGYRDLTEVEKATVFTIWHDIGTRMGILDIPSTLKDLAVYKEDYERKHMVYSDTNKEIAEMTLKLLLSEMPSFLQPIARKLVYAFMDDRLRKAMGYPKQPAWLRAFVHGLVKMHGYVVSWVPPRPLHSAEIRIPSGCPASEGAVFDPDAMYRLSVQRYEPYTYKDGYILKEVGAMKPGCLGIAYPGELLAPLSQCNNLPWPLPLMIKQTKM
ncbi:hypothetical protein L7F22_057541 [Adiantum nelumboides]|nr:hypothetical protein [Adiantum nelumboides]